MLSILSTSFEYVRHPALQFSSIVVIMQMGAAPNTSKNLHHTLRERDWIEALVFIWNSSRCSTISELHPTEKEYQNVILETKVSQTLFIPF